MKKKYDVAILGWWYGLNYGSVLTYYSLYKAISDLGHNILMVHEPLGYNGWRVKWDDDIMSMQFARRMGYNYTEQLHFNDLPSLNSESGTFLVGSDQLWNPLVGRVNDDLFLDFVSPENKRIAYATSFGNRTTEKFKPPFIAKHSRNLEEFSAISVREAYGIDTAKNIFGVEARKVLDPVFLVDRQHYSDLTKQATYTPEGDYMLIFILDPIPEKRKVILSVAKKLGFDKIVIVPNPDEGRRRAEETFYDDIFEIVPTDAPENFLNAYKNANYVITDSFHGTAFSIIFEKPFSSIYNTKRGADRFINLLSDLGFNESRRLFLTDSDEEISNNPNITLDIDFTKAQAHLVESRADSTEWLKHVLLEEKKPVDWQKGVKSKPLVPKYEGKLLNTTFETNAPELIEIENSTEYLKALPKKGSNLKGKHIWFNIPEAIEKGKAYRVFFNWDVVSTTKLINIHLRNPKNGEFKGIGNFSPNARGVFKQDTVDFYVDDPEFNQIMIGSLHLTGDIPSLILNKIRIEKIDKKVKNLKLAIPPVTSSVESIKERVKSSNNILTWENLLQSSIADLEYDICKSFSDITWNGVGGPADFLIYPKSVQEFCDILKIANTNKIKVMVIGNASNLLVRDGGIRGFVVSTLKLQHWEIDGNNFTAGAGCGLIESSKFLLDNGKSSLEWAAGVPGTMGGAVYMNAGTNEGDIRKTIKSVLLSDKKGNLSTLMKEDIDWGKRHTSFMDSPGQFILEATFHTKDGDINVMTQKMKRTVNVRQSHFPLEFPNNGSTFKWWRAPRLVSQAGLVGKQIGGAQVSTKQPGFIVNKGGATAADWEALINHIKSTVYEFSGFLLEPEVVIVGEYPHRFERYSNQEASDTNLDVR